MNSSLRVEPNTLGLIWIRAPGRSALGGKHRIRRAGQPYSARLLNPPNERRAAAQQRRRFPAADTITAAHGPRRAPADARSAPSGGRLLAALGPTTFSSGGRLGRGSKRP